MKTSYLLRGLLGLLLTVGFLSCGDHLNPAVAPGSVPEKMRIKTITQELPDVAGRKASSIIKVSTFTYDGQGRLSTIATELSPDNTAGPVESTVFTYNAQNRLTQARRDIVSGYGAEPAPYEIYTYTYNGTGQVSQLDYENNQGGGGVNDWLITFAYDVDNHLKSSKKSFGISGFTYEDNSTYTFTGNNVTSITRTTKTTTVTTTTSTSTTTFTYDTKTNPFYGIFVIPAPFVLSLSNPQGGNLSYYTYYGGIDNLLNLSQNNLLNDGLDSYSTAYAYTYNGSNLPLTRTTTFQSEITETLTYAYESY
jgi:hypothetical protein